MSKNSTGKVFMKRLFLVALLAAATTVFAQNRTAELDQAYEEARSATTALQQAIARRDQAVESLPGERTGSAAGGSRPNENYFARQAILEQDAEIARNPSEPAMKGGNDLKEHPAGMGPAVPVPLPGQPCTRLSPKF